MTARRVVTQRPAEVGAPVALVVARLVSHVLGVEDAETVWDIAIVLAFVPAAITWLVSTVRG